MSAFYANTDSARERLMELDFALHQAIERRDGEAVRTIADWHATALRHACEQANGDEPCIRIACDRLRDHIARAHAARDALQMEINGLDTRRKLVNAPITAETGRAGRCFKA